MKKLKRFIILLLAFLTFLISTAQVVEANTAYRTFTEDGYGRYVETQTAYTIW